MGVDRVDYTKGIPERLRGVDRLLQKHPELKGQFHFVQVGAPSRTHIPAYRDLTEEVQGLAEKINWDHGTDGWHADSGCFFRTTRRLFDGLVHV